MVLFIKYYMAEFVLQGLEFIGQLGLMVCDGFINFLIIIYSFTLVDPVVLQDFIYPGRTVRFGNPHARFAAEEAADERPELLLMFLFVPGYFLEPRNNGFGIQTAY